MISITDRLICIAYREADMTPMLVYRHIEGDLFARVVPGACLAEACQLFDIPARSEPKLPAMSRYVHLKSRGTYRTFGEAVRNEACPTGEPFVLYQCLSQRVSFLRPHDEFHDGRFRLLGAA